MDAMNNYYTTGTFQYSTTASTTTTASTGFGNPYTMLTYDFGTGNQPMSPYICYRMGAGVLHVPKLGLHYFSGRSHGELVSDDCTWCQQRIFTRWHQSALRWDSWKLVSAESPDYVIEEIPW